MTLLHELARFLPRYQCHKQVRAVKIREIVPVTPPAFQNPVCRGSFLFGSACGHCERCEWERSKRSFDAGAMIVPDEAGCPVFAVTRAYLMKHDPKPGGYYVLYGDGYDSYSPAQAFEEGYSRL